MISDSALPASFHELVSLFDNALSEVRFPGVDADVLRTHQADVAKAEDAVREAEGALAEARLALREREQAALDRAERALSYLRVFATDDETVAGAIAGLSLSRPVLALNGDATRRRGRPRKTVGDLLPLSEMETEQPTLSMVSP